jgi:hypothetical protein
MFFQNFGVMLGVVIDTIPKFGLPKNLLDQQHTLIHFRTNRRAGSKENSKTYTLPL